MGTFDRTNAPTVQRIAELQQLIADLSRVLRMVNLADTNRRENDVEHSFGLALTCWFMAPKVAPHLDLQKIILYALSHDIIEIYSGDTFIFDKKRVATKVKRETDALERLKAEWPDFKELTNAAHEYMKKQNDEAKFVYAVDKMLPPLMINLGEKADYWNRHKITRKMLEDEKVEKMGISKDLAKYAELLNQWLKEPDYFYKSNH